MDAKSFALRLILTIPALGSLPGGRMTPGETRPLYAVGAPAALPTGYGLRVASVPAPPQDLPISTLGIGPTCPVEVRAIVTGEAPNDTFVVVAVGEESVLLQKSQGVRTRQGWVAISEIVADHVVLHKGDQVFDCFLGSPAGDVRSGTEESAR